MYPNRIARVLLGLIALAIFCAYTYYHGSVSPRTRDLTGYSWGMLGHVGELQHILPDSTPQGEITAAEPQEEPSAEAPAVEDPASEEPEASAETPEPTVDPESPYGKALANAAARGLPTPPQIDIYDWSMMLVNGEHSIDQYAPAQLAYLNQTADEMDIQYNHNDNRCPVDERIAEALLNMARGCRDAGLPVFLSSGYRSYSDQAANFTRVCQNNGVTDGKDSAGHYITMPAGCSEHQTGLCCDITDIYRPIKNSEIENTQTFQWLKAHCAEYGFVVRFPAEKADITNVMYEPFHFRYVGTEVAAYMTENNLCLEEFLALYGVE